jgi:hypothetical protein
MKDFGGLIRVGAARMDFHTLEGISQNGFEGFKSISALRASNCEDVPDHFGVYLIVRKDRAVPTFCEKSTGGHFKRKEPTVQITKLQENWIDDALVLNIGKAGPRKGRTLKKRLREYIWFGHGMPVGHRGGRYIWQLGEANDLLVCWRVLPDVDPENFEKDLILPFENVYDRMPFANLRH